MKERARYAYSILRYVHDVATGEFVNVGVALYCQKSNYFDVKFRTTVGRVSEFFPDVKKDAFRSLMKALKGRYKELRDIYSSPINFGDRRGSLEEVIGSVMPKDDSALIWSDVSYGVSADPEKTLDQLYARYVAKYDHKILSHHRTDADIWRGFKKELANRSVLEAFEEKVIAGKDDEVKFSLAWKNGVWHCIETLSFDLGASESIRDKAHKCIGQIASVADSNEQFKLYLLVGKPTEKGLDKAFERAVNLLGKMPIPTEIYYEEQSSSLVDKFASQIGSHHSSSITH